MSKANATYEGLELKTKALKQTTDITEWRKAEIYCEPLPQGTAIQFQYKLDKNGDWITSYMEGGEIALTATNETKAIFFIEEKGDIFEPRIIISSHLNYTPEIHRIRIYFE